MMMNGFLNAGTELVGADFWEEGESWTIKRAVCLVAEHIKGGRIALCRVFGSAASRSAEAF